MIGASVGAGAGLLILIGFVAFFITKKNNSDKTKNKGTFTGDFCRFTCHDFLFSIPRKAKNHLYNLI